MDDAGPLRLPRMEVAGPALAVRLAAQSADRSP